MPDEKFPYPAGSPGVPVLRVDALDDLDETEAEVAKGGVVTPATRLVCAVCGLTAGTCGHQPSLTTEVPDE